MNSFQTLNYGLVMINLSFRHLRQSLLMIAFSAFFLLSFAKDGEENIRLNQLGFYPVGPKTAVVVSPQTWYFSIMSPDLKKTYYTGELTALKPWKPSGEEVKIADFSNFTLEGTYVVYVSGVGVSYPFSIKSKIHETVAKGLIKAFYYQRASTSLPAQYAGSWQRDGGHFDERVSVHYSAASDPSKEGARTTGQVFSAPKGWYDAGDYGKYVVNAGITTYQLLVLYQLFPAYFDTLDLNIPESDNALPDLLDEIKWEMDWLLKMQDPADGGVYHKLTGANFIGELMPANAEEPRYFIGKGSAATFDFAAICALASRIYRQFLPSFADSCLDAAKYAWTWGSEHPDSAFNNPPDIVTGAYSDNKIGDEHFWAGMELFLATEDSVYFNGAKPYSKGYGVPSWPGVGLLGNYSMALSGDSLAKERVLSTANAVIARVNTHPYRTTVENGDFYWGSNGVVANYGMCALVAYLLSNDIKYLEGSIHSLDYLLGRNATGYSFITGFGSRPAMRPHHRPSIADPVSNPVPGFLVGGPNSQESSRGGETCTDPYSTFPAKAWLDHECSFSSNEIAINWNAPAAFLAGGLEAVFNLSGFDLQGLYDKNMPDTVAPQSSVFEIIGIGADKAVINWKTPERVIAAIEYTTDSLFLSSRKLICPSDDSASVKLNRLVPSSKYFVKAAFTDKNGNTTVETASFTTGESPLYSASVYAPKVTGYKSGSLLQISFDGAGGMKAKLLLSQGGKAGTDTLEFAETNGSYTAGIPGEKVTDSGILYSILLASESDTLLTPGLAAAPDSVQMTKDNLAIAKAYTLISLPLIYSPVSSYQTFKGAFGDSTDWRFYGYSPDSGTYTGFDNMRSGNGGWLFHKQKRSFTFKAGGIKPDTLFPVTLKKGWNCIGNPFPFPVYWDNILVRSNDALVRVTDTAASAFMRRQYFTYKDSLPDSRNNGAYRSNRAMITNVYNDSARLEPWEACWVYAEDDSVTCLIDPSAQKTAPALSKKRSFTENYWACLLKAASGDLSDISAFGANEHASDGYDIYDSPKPPSIQSQLQIGFSHPEWKKPGGLYISDIVNSQKGSHCWELNIRSSSNKPVTISWEKSGQASGYLFLCDKKSGAVIDMSKTGSYTFDTENGESVRKLAISWKQSIDPGLKLDLTTWEFSAVKAASGSAVKLEYTIPFSVKDGCDVSIQIYDVGGRCVSRLVNGHKMPGRHTVSWNGLGTNKSAVAKGMYVARFKTPAFSETKVVNIIK